MSQLRVFMDVERLIDKMADADSEGDDVSLGEVVELWAVDPLDRYFCSRG